MSTNNPQNMNLTQEQLDNISSVIGGQKSSYQQNLAQPVQNDNWYSGAIPTSREIYGRIYEINKTDPQMAGQIATGFAQAQKDPSSPWYAPYRQATNTEALGILSNYGIDVSNIDEQWFRDNSWAMQYQASNAKKASAEQRVAWAYNKVADAYGDTSSAKSELSALQEEIDYLANWEGKNYSDQQIKDMIYGADGSEFKKKYPTLAKMDASYDIGGSVLALNSGIDYSRDNIDTMLWRARNNGGTGNYEIDTALSVSGEGNAWVDDPAITEKLNWNNADTYSPFSTGMTLVEEGKYFGVYEFTPEIIEQLRETLDPNDATAMKMFDNVVAAEDTTEKGEAERNELYGKVDDWIAKGYSAEKIMEKVDYLLDKNKYPTLNQMDKSMRSSDQKLLSTTRAIDYKYEDLKRYVEDKTAGPKESGVEQANNVLSRAGAMFNQFSGQEVESDKAETALLKDSVASVEDQLTSAESAFLNNASSGLWGKLKDTWNLWNQAVANGEGISQEFALAQMEKADKEYTASAFEANKTIKGYENAQQQYTTASQAYDTLFAEYGDLQYIGAELNPRNRLTIEVDGKPVNVWINLDEQTGEYVFGGADFMDNAGQLVQSGTQKFRDYVGNEEEWNALIEQETSKFNEYAQNVNRVASEGHRPTKEGQEKLQEMYTAKALMEDAKAYMEENQAAYDEAVIAERKAREKFARSYTMLNELGMNTDNGKTHLAMLDYAMQYGSKKPKENTGYSDINAVDDILRTDTSGQFTMKDLAEATNQTIAEIDEEIADIAFLAEYFGDEIPEAYRNGMKDQIAELEWRKKDYQYFLLGANDDWDEMVAKGDKENIWTNNTPLLGKIDNDIRDMWWSTLTDEEKDRFNYLVGKEGTEAAKEYFVHLQENGMLDKRRMDTIKGNAAEAAEKYPILSNAFAIVTAPISGIGSAVSLFNTALTGESSSDKMSMFYNNVANEINQTTTQKIQEAFKDNPVVRDIVQGAYEIVYNRGRSAMNAFLFPGLGAMSEFAGAVPMAASAMADEVMKLKDAGVDDAKAWLLGTVTFLCEAGTEMIELKDIKAAKELGLNTLAGIKDFLKQYPIAGFNEMLGESLNDIIENASDYIVLGDDGERAERAWYYRTTLGMSKEDAEAKAYQDEIYGVLHTAIISFLSPGMDVMSYASGRIALNNHYKRQAKDYNMSLRDIRTNEQTRARYAEQEEQIEEKVNSVPTLDVAGAQQEIDAENNRIIEEEKKEKENNNEYLVNMEALETAGQTSDANARSSALASVLTTGEGENESDIANAAAVNIGNAFEGGVDEVQELMQGGLVAGVDPVQLKKGIQYAALGQSIYGDGACYRLVHSDKYRNAMPDDKAMMLAAAAQADEQNQNVQKSVADAVHENRVAEQEAILIKNGALDGTKAAERKANDTAAEVRKANDEVQARQGELDAATQALDAARQEAVNNPSDQNTKQIIGEAANVRKKDESVKQYEQHQANMVAQDEKASADLDAVRQKELSAVRQQAEAVVAQKDQERARVAQQKAEQEQLAAQVREQAIKDAKELNNFSRLDAEEQVDKMFPNISKADRRRAIRIYMAVQKAASSGVQSVQARQDFTNKLAKKFKLKVQTVPAQGNVFNARIDPKTRTLYVNERTNQSDVMYAILIHEITHPAENAKELYTEMANMVLQNRYGKGVTYNGLLDLMAKGDVSSQAAQDVLARKQIYDGIINDRPAHSYEEMLQEIVADGVGYLIAGDQKAIDQLVAEKPNLARRILASIKNFIRKMSGLDDATLTQAQKVADMLEKSLEATWGGEQKNSIDQTQTLVADDNGDPLATELPGDTIALNIGDRYSLNSFNAEEQMRVRQALLDKKDADGNPQYTEEEVDKYLGDALSIASMIAADKTRLDFEASDNQVFLKSNNDYYFTLDASTLCAKRLLYQGTFDYVQHALPDEVFTPEDLIDLVNIMNDMGFETPCGICYVESRRRWLDTYAQKFLDTLPEEGRPSIDDLTTSDGLEKLRHNDPEMYKAFVDAMNAKGSANPKLVQLRTEYRGDIGKLTAKDIQKVKDIGGLRIQSFSDFETPHLLDMIQAVYDMSAVGLTSQAYTKVPNFAWVFGDTGIKINLSLIGKGTGLDENGNLVFDNREGINFDEAMKLRERYGANVGTILVGINDEHIIAAMGDPRIDFIIPFHKSGWSAEELRKMPTLNNYKDYTNSQNERIIIERVNKVLKEWKTKNDVALQKWIEENGDNYIGYRVENTEKGYRIVFDGYKTESFKKHNDRTKEKLANFEPVGANQYWDFSKSGQWNAEHYLEMCAKAHRMPKFSQFLVDNGDGTFSLPQGTDKRSTAIREGYWKTLIDFKMYENDSYGRTKEDGTMTEVKGAEQSEVTPDINMAEAYRVMNEYKLGRQMPDQADGTPGRFIPMENNNSVPVAVPAAEEYIELIKRKRERTKPEGPGPDALEADLPVNPKASAFGASQAPAVLGNTEGDSTETSSAQQNAMAIDAETGETVMRHSLPAAIDNVFEDMSVEELWSLLGLSDETEEEARKIVTNAVKDIKDEFDPTIYNGKLYLKPETLDYWLSGHGFASSNPNYAQAYITTMNPADFLRMTTASESGQQRILSEATPLDEDELSENALRQPIQLDIDEETGIVGGHEGRHRSVALARAGVTEIPVLLFDNSTKYSKTAKPEMTLQGQSAIPDTDNGNTYTFHDVIPLNNANMDEIFRRFTASAEDESAAETNGQHILRYSLPSDAPYLSAVNHGDMEEAQRLVDEKAKEAGYIYGKVYHGTPNNDFTEFKDGFIFFTSNEDTASEYRDPGDMWRTRYEGGRTLGSYIKIENPLILDNSYSDYRNEHTPWQEWKPTVYGRVPDNAMNAMDVAERAKELGYDGVVIRNDKDTKWSDSSQYLKNRGRGDTIIAFNAEQIKSADPVTYDEEGNVIPLSERFNTEKRDFRYSLPSDDILEQQFRYAIENGEETEVERKERQWGREGLQRSDEIAQQAKDYVLAHNKYYPDTNEEQINRAIDWIRSQKTPRDPDGYNTAFQKVTAPGYNFRSADGQARMIAMMGMAVARNDVPGQVQLSNTYNKQGTVLGQALQARKLWKLMTPEGRISSLEKMLEDTKAELDRRGIVLDKPLKFSDWVYLAATAEQEDGDMQRLYQMAGHELAEQIPANWRDKIRSFRMLAMLGNPRTHIRNFIGNAMFVPAVGLKNKIAAIGESIFLEPGERTKTLSLFLNEQARAFAKEDALRMKDELTGEAKYNELNAVQKEQKAFKGLLQAVIDFNGNRLEAEDWRFLRGHYVRALGGWMMANNYTEEQLWSNPTLLEQGRAYAIQEAQKATYRDFSKMASVLNKVSREGGVAGFVVDAVLPFKKTPANILKRGIEYSPVGLMKSLTTDIYHYKQWRDAQAGKYGAIPEKALSPTQFIDHLCSGLSGSLIMGMGYLMSRLGLVTCGLNDDDDELEKIKGAQKYAIKILGTDVTYTMDWAAPMSMPFFVGAAVQQQIGEQDGFNVDDIVDALGNISEPVFNLSMLDGVNTLFKTSQYDDTNTITQIGAKIGSNYVTSYVPSLLGAITRTFTDDKRRKAYVKSGEGTGVLGTLRYAWEQTENKLPGLSQTNIPYRDVWGNPEVNDTFGSSGFAQFVERAIENFISPGYISRTKSDPVLTEIGRLYDVTHDDGLIPSDPSKSVSYKNQRYALTAEEWDKYKETRGQTALNCLTELMSTEDYKNATDDEQAQMVKNIWTYAGNVGKAAVIPDYLLENSDNPIEEATQNAKVTRYKAKMLQCLGSGDIEGYDTMVEALREADVSDSTIKSSIRNAYHDKYIAAYLKDDYETMSEIENILDNTDFDFDLDEWEEKADEKYLH